MSTNASTMKRNTIMSKREQEVDSLPIIIESENTIPKESVSPPLERRNELEDANRHDEKIQEWDEENHNS